MAIAIILILTLIVINGFFAAAEIALISSRKSSLKQDAEEGSKGAETALKLNEDTPRLLATIQICVTLAGMFASALTAVTFEEPLRLWLQSLGVPFLQAIAPGIAVFSVTILISYVTLVLGELVPKQLGIQNANKVASFTAMPIRFVSGFLKPAVSLLAASASFVARIFGIKSDGSENAVSEEEIKMLVDEQEELGGEEKRMITEIFELGDTVVREVMVPRVDIVFANDTESVGEAAKRLYARGFSRVPVYHDDHDQILGILILKDLIVPLAAGEGDQPITKYLRDPVFVPETKDLMSTLNEMQEARIQMIIVVDEYGGTAGVVSMEDILEEITGEIIDETDQELDDIRPLDEDTWLVDGTTDVEDAIEAGFPLELSDEYETIAGWLLEQLGHIPHVGEYVEFENFKFTVIAMRRRRIARLRVERLEPAPATEDEEETTD
jgi:putative hemolysin